MGVEKYVIKERYPVPEEFLKHAYIKGRASYDELYRRSLDLNVNLIWGLVLLVFGALMLLFAWRAGRQAEAAAPSTTR